MALRFKISDLQREIQFFLSTARPFLTPGTTYALEQAKSELDQIAKRKEGRYKWEVALDSPLRTILSRGEYMPDDQGQLFVYAEISFVWDVHPYRPPGASRRADFLDLDGRASTVIRIVEGDPNQLGTGKEIAMWRMEIADDQAPGTYFHVQVLGQAKEPPFPKALDIPRLPGLFVSPMAAAEFAIAELFQDRWRKHSNRASGDMQSWGALQLKRTKAQLSWHMNELESSNGSPWNTLKRAKPPHDLFLS